MVVIAEITPLRFIGVSSGLMGGIFALSSLLGPVLEASSHRIPRGSGLFISGEFMLVLVMHELLAVFSDHFKSTY